MSYPEALTVDTIWDEIAFFLVSPRDLLSLALTSRVFKELIIPDHLEYRYIRCDVRRQEVWTFLTNRPRLARGIETVELIYEPQESPRLPKALTVNDTPAALDPDLDLDSDQLYHHGRDRKITDANMALIGDLMDCLKSLWEERFNIRLPQNFGNVPGLYCANVTEEDTTLFRNSISQMISLKRFIWKQEYTSPQGIIDVFHVLTNKTPGLEALSVDLRAKETALNREGSDLDNSSIWTFTGLNKFIIRQPKLAAIQMIIHLCSDIEDLFLSKVSPASAYHLMQYANLNKLRRLSLSLDEPEFEEEDADIATVIAPFLNRHPTLEVLHLGANYYFPIPNAPLTPLPKIYSIGLSVEYGFKPSSLFSDEIMSRLVHWRCPIQNIDINAFPRLDSLESLYNTGEVSTNSLTQFLRKVPNLKRLYSNKIKEYNDYLAWKEPPQGKLMKNLLKYPHLTHIFCDFRVIGSKRISSLEKLGQLCERFSALPALKYFEVTLDGNSDQHFVNLKRDEEGLYSGYQFVTRKEAYGDICEWGGFFFSLVD